MYNKFNAQKRHMRVHTYSPKVVSLWIPGFSLADLGRIVVRCAALLIDLRLEDKQGECERAGYGMM